MTTLINLATFCSVFKFPAYRKWLEINRTVAKKTASEKRWVLEKTLEKNNFLKKNYSFINSFGLRAKFFVWIVKTAFYEFSFIFWENLSVFIQKGLIADKKLNLLLKEFPIVIWLTVENNQKQLTIFKVYKLKKVKIDYGRKPREWKSRWGTPENWQYYSLKTRQDCWRKSSKVVQAGGAKKTDETRWTETNVIEQKGIVLNRQSMSRPCVLHMRKRRIVGWRWLPGKDGECWFPQNWHFLKCTTKERRKRRKDIFRSLHAGILLKRCVFILMEVLSSKFFVKEAS